MGSLETTLPHRSADTQGRYRLRQHLRQASSDIRTPRTQQVGTDVDIWDMSGQMRGGCLGQKSCWTGEDKSGGAKFRMDWM